MGETELSTFIHIWVSRPRRTFEVLRTATHGMVPCCPGFVLLTD